MDKNKIQHEPRHLGIPSGASNMIFEPMVRSTQTVQLSCTDTNIVSKWTEKRLDMSHVTYEFYRVRPIWFPSLWYVHHKPCTNLASRLALSPNCPKQASTWASSGRSTIGCVQNNFWAMVRLAQTVHLSCTDTNIVSKRTKMRFRMTHVTLVFHRVRPKRFRSLWYVRCKLRTYLAWRLALSPNGPKWAFTWALSPRSNIGCIQNVFWAYGMFGVNHAPILH
jgi:hypothetical protein